jgi:hypothetical protein
MSFASVSRTSAVGTGLVYPIQPLYFDNNNPFTLQPQNLYMIKSNVAGDKYINLPSAKIGEWIKINYFAGTTQLLINTIVNSNPTELRIFQNRTLDLIYSAYSQEPGSSTLAEGWFVTSFL